MAYDVFFDPDFESAYRREFEKLYDPQRDLDCLFADVEAHRSLSPWKPEDQPDSVEHCRCKIRREMKKRQLQAEQRAKDEQDLPVLQRLMDEMDELVRDGAEDAAGEVYGDIEHWFQEHDHSMLRDILTPAQQSLYQEYVEQEFGEERTAWIWKKLHVWGLEDPFEGCEVPPDVQNALDSHEINLEQAKFAAVQVAYWGGHRDEADEFLRYCPVNGFVVEAVARVLDWPPDEHPLQLARMMLAVEAAVRDGFLDDLSKLTREGIDACLKEYPLDCPGTSTTGTREGVRGSVG